MFDEFHTSLDTAGADHITRVSCDRVCARALHVCGTAHQQSAWKHRDFLKVRTVHRTAGGAGEGRYGQLRTGQYGALGPKGTDSLDNTQKSTFFWVQDTPAQVVHAVSFHIDHAEEVPVLAVRVRASAIRAVVVLHGRVVRIGEHADERKAKRQNGLGQPSRGGPEGSVREGAFGQKA